MKDLVHLATNTNLLLAFVAMIQSKLFVELNSTLVNKFVTSNLIANFMTAKRLATQVSVLHVLMTPLALFIVRQAITQLKN